MATPASAQDRLRVATFTTELSARGPGLLLRSLRQPPEGRLASVIATIAAVDPDILVLQGIDYDHGQVALSALRARLAEAGSAYPHIFSARPNSGMTTGLDLDGDGRRGTPRDAQGYGTFAGAGGMAILSRQPILTGKVTTFTDLIWRDLPGASLPDGTLPDAVLAVQRLSSVAHWDVPVLLADGRVLRLLTWHATPPVFDGPEDRNGYRNHDEAALWLRHLEGALDRPAPEPPLVVIGNANLDPHDGEGQRGALAALLSHPLLHDPRPASAGGVQATRDQQGVNAAHLGPPALDTADWDDAGPGNLRVSYILPSRDIAVAASGVFWPLPGTPGAAALGPADLRSRHRLVWADLNPMADPPSRKSR